MATTYDADDADLAVVQDRQVAVLGHGEQALAQALSLRDSGVDVRVGLDQGSARRAEADAEGLRVLAPYDACEESDLIALLLPWAEQRKVFEAAVAPNLVAGDALLFADGRAVRFGAVPVPPRADVCLVAPQGPAEQLRRAYEAGRGLPVLVAVEQDASGAAWPLTLSYAKAIGGLRSGALRTSFAEQAEADLFGADALVGGGLARLLVAGFDTLTEAGYQPEVAYLSCVGSLERLLEFPGAAGSPVGEYAGSRLVDGSVRARLAELLQELREGALAGRLDDHEPAAPPADRPGMGSTGALVRERFGWPDRRSSEGPG